MYKLYPHQEELVQEAKNSFRKGFKSPCIVSPCGSGKSVIIADIVKSATEKNNRVLFLIHRKELKDQIIETFKNYGVDMSFVDVYMVQTLVNKLDKIEKPNLIITDENHHALAKTYKKIYDYFSSCLKLGFTATPIRLNGVGLSDVNDTLVIGKSVNWLIQNNFLANFRYFAPEIINTHNLKVTHGDYKVSDLTMNRIIYSDVLKTYERLAKGKKAICYCPNVEFSKKIANEFCESNIKAIHLDAKTEKKERESIIKDFREGKIQILCNVDLIGEGFDVPDCEVVILLRPTKSLSLFIQQSMRSMRYRPNKTATIIDCVGNVERFGLPNLEREWSLEGETKEQRENKLQDNPKTCPECFAAIDKKYLICPCCGFEFRAEQEVEIDTTVELKEIKENDFSFRLNTKDWKECKNMKELRNWCIDNNYKPGRAYYLGKILKLI